MKLTNDQLATAIYEQQNKVDSLDRHAIAAHMELFRLTYERDRREGIVERVNGKFLPLSDEREVVA